MEEVVRRVGRAPDAVRSVHVVPNVLAHCHSSACVEIGATRVICAVRPPQQLVQEYRGGSRGRVSCQVHRSASGLAISGGAGNSSGGMNDVAESSRERAMALALEGVAEQVVRLETIPQLLVEVVVEVVRDDGALFDAASTAMATALAVGGFEMRDMFSACTAGLLADGAVVVDLGAEEARHATVAVTLCACLTTGGVVFLSHRGACELATLSQLVEAAQKGLQLRKPHLLDQIRHAV